MLSQFFCNVKYNSFPLIYFGTTDFSFPSINLNYKLYKPIKSTTVTCNIQAYLVFVQVSQIFIPYFACLLDIYIVGKGPTVHQQLHFRMDEKVVRF